MTTAFNLDFDDGDNRTELTFCRENVDPQHVTLTLELEPTQSYRVGEDVPFRGAIRTSTVGMWKLRLSNPQRGATIGEQLGQWSNLLGAKAEALALLRKHGYEPYISCRAESRSLSVSIEPEVLTGLGALGIALSIWLFEAPPAVTADAPINGMRPEPAPHGVLK